MFPPEKRNPGAQNDALLAAYGRAITGVLCVEDHEHICADMARLAALICRRSVRAFGARKSGADRQLCARDCEQLPWVWETLEAVEPTVVKFNS
jgi:hypothetical protein